MAENIQEQSPSPRMVNADVLTTQEMRMVRIAKENPEGKPPTALPSPNTHHREAPLDWLMKAFVTVFAATTLFSLAALAVLMWITPPWYKSLPPSQQVIWCNRVAALCDLKPTTPASDILALDDSQVDNEAALALLNAPTATATPTPTVNATAVPPTLTMKGGNNLTQSVPPVTTVVPTSTPAPPALALPSKAAIELERLEWEQQGWNNCGPTTLTIGLTFYGYGHDQDKAVEFLKPGTEDKNVSPSEMVAYVNTQASQEIGVSALYRIGGTPELLKALIEADFPIIIERGIDVPGSGWMGHYSLIVGYDDTTREYLLFDSYFGHGEGAGRREGQDAIHAGWKDFNHTFIVIYSNNRQNELQTVLGNFMDEQFAANSAFELARQEATQNPDDKWAWFNMGTALTVLGRYSEAVLAFDRARTLALPFRMLWYQFAPYEAYYHMKRYDDVLALALANENQTPYLEETYYYRGLVFAARGEVEDAIEQFDKALRHNKNFSAAQDAKQAVLEGRFVTPS